MSELWHNARLATLREADGPQPIPGGALLVRDGDIAWAGPLASMPRAMRDEATAAHDLGGALVTPGLVDCHTHLVYGGDRAGEFERRLQGATYAQIAAEGGGIRSTVRATRAASEADLLELASRRLAPLLAEGLCAVEVKSGYGLEPVTEARMLRVARALGARHGITVRTTFLGAHAVPEEFSGRPDEYIDEVCRWMPALHAEGLVDCVDAFCDPVGFTLEQTRRVLAAARALGIDVRLHSEQFGNLGGSALAAHLGALSCDHLEHLDDVGARAMAQAGTVAVLLPGAFHFLRETRLPPVALLRDLKVPMAVATDHNPGSSPVLSLRLMMGMSCTLFGLSPWEALAGVTLHAARALRLESRLGSLEAGKRADFVAWDAQDPRELCYWIGGNPCRTVVRAGRAQGTAAGTPGAESPP